MERILRKCLRRERFQWSLACEGEVVDRQRVFQGGKERVLRTLSFFVSTRKVISKLEDEKGRG